MLLERGLDILLHDLSGLLQIIAKNVSQCNKSSLTSTFIIYESMWESGCYWAMIILVALSLAWTLPEI